MRHSVLTPSARVRSFSKPGLASLGVGLSLLGLAVATNQPARSQRPGATLPLPISGTANTTIPALSITQNGAGAAGYFQNTDINSVGNAVTADVFGEGYALAGFAHNPISDGVYGQHSLTSNWGALGTESYGVIGEHGATRNNGSLATVDYGVRGEYYPNGNIGYLGTKDAGVYGASYNGTFAGQFDGKVQMTGFIMPTVALAGYVLTTDDAGNGTWQPAPKGPKGDKGDPGPKGDTGANGKDGTNGTNGTNGQNGKDGNPGPQGPQGPPGTAVFNRKPLDVPDGKSTTIPTGYSLIGVTGHGGGGTSLVLPRANSVAVGTMLVLSLENPNQPGIPLPITILTQRGDTIPSLPASTNDTLVYNTTNPAMRYYSDGVSHWYHW